MTTIKNADGQEKLEENLNKALAELDKSIGKGQVIRFSEDAEMFKVETFPSGSLAIDIALGSGGLPKGRIIEIYGPESSGKSLFTLHAIVEAQKLGMKCLFIDVEHAFNADWARKIGVNLEELILARPQTGEDAFTILDKMMRTGAIGLAVVDSVAALLPVKEESGEFGDAQMGSQARLMSQGMRKITPVASTYGTTVIFINQLRDKIGVVFGSPSVTSGGNALKYYASVRMEIRRIEGLKDGADEIGNRTRVSVVKNKVGAPKKRAEFDILYKEGEEGYSREADIRDFGVLAGLIGRSGSWFTLAVDVDDTWKKGTQLGQGGEKARIMLKENPDLADKLDALIREKYLTKKEVRLEEMDQQEFERAQNT